MIQIYNPNNTNYEKNGDMPLTPSSATIHTILNGSWDAELHHPIDQDGRWKYIVEGAVVKMPSFNGDQLFRVKNKQKADSGIDATMEPIFYDAKDDCWLTDVRPTGKNGQEALNIMTAPNSKYSGKSDITLQSTAYYEYMNLMEAINGNNDNSFVNRWGGEILFDNFYVIINQRVGGDYGVEIRYGKNVPVDGLTEEVDTRDVVTRIYPKAFNGYTMTDHGYVDSPLINNYPTIKCATLTFEDVKMREDAQEDDEENGVTVCDTQAELDAALRAKCNEQYTAGLDKPSVSISADMILLQNTEQYKDYEILESVSLGDTVHCRNQHLDIVTDARVIELKYNSILKRVESVVIGDYQYNYFQDVTSTVNRVESAIRPDGSVIGQQVQGIINGVKAQMKAQTSAAKKVNVRAVLFEDTDPESPTYGAMCWGTMGFQIASKKTEDGRDWDWTTFGTGQGFYANLIVAKTMLADRVRGGKFVAGGGDGQNGVIQILDEAGEEIGRWDLNGLNVKEGEISGTGITLGGGTGKNGYIRILNSAGEEIGRWDLNGLNVKEGEISGTDITLGGRNNENGSVEILDASGEVIVRINNYGITVDHGEDGGIAIRNGAIFIRNANGSTVGTIRYQDNGVSISAQGGSGFSAFLLKNDGSVSITGQKSISISSQGDVMVGGRTTKTGRAEFSDGTYLDVQNGAIVGGNAKEGGKF